MIFAEFRAKPTAKLRQAQTILVDPDGSWRIREDRLGLTWSIDVFDVFETRDPAWRCIFSSIFSKDVVREMRRRQLTNPESKAALSRLPGLLGGQT